MGLKVLFVTADGASANRKLFNMHASRKGEYIYKAPNIFSNDGRYIHFFVDPPHLLKTARNCFSQSFKFAHGNRRALWVSFILAFSRVRSAPPNIHFKLQRYYTALATGNVKMKHIQMHLAAKLVLKCVCPSNGGNSRAIKA